MAKRTKYPTAEQILAAVLDSINAVDVANKARDRLAHNATLPLTLELIDELAKNISQSVVFLLEGEEDTIDSVPGCPRCGSTADAVPATNYGRPTGGIQYRCCGVTTWPE